MNLLTAKKAQQSFSRVAGTYENFADIQKQIGMDLLAMLPLKKMKRILDVGMGTGWLTEKIKEKYPGAYIIGLDFAFGMARQASAKNIDAVFQADAQALPFKANRFDMVVSNCAYQWVADLPRALAGCYKVLAKEGSFIFTLFGQNTLKELSASLDIKDFNVGLPGDAQIFDILFEKGFGSIEIKKRMMQREFEDIFALIRWLKRIGANRTQRDTFVGRDLLKKADMFYKENFSSKGKIYASFEIIEGKAKK